MQFEAFAHYARHESGKPESASCFDALAASVDDVSPELLEAYVEMFQKIEHRKIGSALKQSIQQGLWSPTEAHRTVPVLLGGFRHLHFANSQIYLFLSQGDHRGWYVGILASGSGVSLGCSETRWFH